MARRNPVNDSGRYTKRLLRRINKTHLSGDKLREFSTVVHSIPKRKRDFVGISLAAIRVFDAGSDAPISAYFRMVALNEIIGQDKLPGWVKPPSKDGGQLTHFALFDAAGKAPLRENGQTFSFNRTAFLRIAFQCAKAYHKQGTS